MSVFQKEESLDSVSTDEEIKTQVSDSNEIREEHEESNDVILESIDESDISSVQSLPDEFAQSVNYRGRSFSVVSELGKDSNALTPKSTARTPRTQRTLSYTDDFELDSVDPRGAVVEPQTARTIPDVAYSSDFESTWQNDHFKQKKPSESLDTYTKKTREPDLSASLETTGRSYSTETFESETLSTDRTESSESDSISVTQTSFSDSSRSQDSDGSEEELSSLSSVTDASFQPDSEDERRFIDAKYDFFVKKLMLLERKNRGEYVVKRRTEPEEKESTRQKSFCQRKIELLRNKNRNREGADTDRGTITKEAEPVRTFSQIANDPVEKHGIAEAALHRLQMENTMHNIKKAANMKIHKPKNCKDCREKLAEATERSFFQQKLAVVSEKLLKDKLLLQSNPGQEFAEGLKELPSHKDDPKDVYERLMKTARQRSSQHKADVSVAVQTIESRPPEPVIKHLKDYTEEELKLDNMDLANEPSKEFWNKYFEPLQNCSWFPKQ